MSAGCSGACYTTVFILTTKPTIGIKVMDMTPPTDSARKAFNDAIRVQNMTPLWEVLHALVPQQPATPCVPAFWAYERVRPYLAK